MDSRPRRLSGLLDRASKAMGFILARGSRFRNIIEPSGFGISLIPGLLTWNINFRAGGSG